jgi:RNA polymerase sigma-70 factor (ECF subfamily)
MGPKLKSTYQVDESFVEDVAQETLIIIIKKLDTFRGDSSFFTWVCSIAVRLALGELRHKRWSDYSLDALTADNAFDMPSTGGDFTENIATMETFNSVKMSIMTALTEKQRTALLAELDGMTTDEIARRYNSTRGAIYKLTHDARRALIKDLRRKNFELEGAL